MKRTDVVVNSIREDLVALFKAISEDDSFMKAENYIRRYRRHSENTLKDSDAVNDAEVGVNGNIFSLYYYDYLYYVNYGRKPSNNPSKKPPIGAIIEWCRKKGLPTDNEVVYAIRETIWRFGIKPRPIISMFVQNLDRLWDEDWSDKLFEEIMREINNIFNES